MLTGIEHPVFVCAVHESRVREVLCVCVCVHFKVKVNSSWIINVAAFFLMMLNQTLELLPLENQLSKLI